MPNKGPKSRSSTPKAFPGPSVLLVSSCCFPEALLKPAACLLCVLLLFLGEDHLTLLNRDPHSEGLGSWLLEGTRSLLESGLGCVWL